MRPPQPAPIRGRTLRSLTSIPDNATVRAGDAERANVLERHRRPRRDGRVQTWYPEIPIIARGVLYRELMAPPDHPARC